MAIERPTKLYDFGSVQVAPAYEIDRQFDNHKRSIDAIIKQLAKVVRADGKLNNDLLTPESFPKQILEKIQIAALSDAVRAQKATAEMLKEITERQIAIEASTKELRSLIQKNERDNQTTRALGAEVQARSVALSTTITPQLVALRQDAEDDFNAANEVLRQAAVAEDWANVSIAWAEHMPDTIPPNILATNAITGEHWSSRWWAHRAEEYVNGILVGYYMGAFPTPPTETITGEPLQTGALYYDTTLGAMQVWDGANWIGIFVPQKAATFSLYYRSFGNATLFFLSSPDLFGNSYTANITSGDEPGIQVYLNGVRLVPGAAYDFTNAWGSGSGSNITLTRPAPVGAILTVDVLPPLSQLAPGAVRIIPLDDIIPNGFSVIYALRIAADGSLPTISSSQEVVVSLDGAIQKPGDAYIALNAVLQFAEPPSADSKIFLLWYAPP